LQLDAQPGRGFQPTPDGSDGGQLIAWNSCRR
jgi:hypothetical protein